MNIETVNAQLAYLAETKSLIRLAIQNKGQEVTDLVTFRDYATKIDGINQGTLLDLTDIIYTSTVTTASDDNSNIYAIRLTTDYVTSKNIKKYDFFVFSYAPESGEDVGNVGILVGVVNQLTSILDTGMTELQFDLLVLYRAPVEDLVEVLRTQDNLLSVQQTLLNEISTSLDNRTIGLSAEADSVIDEILGEGE